MAYLTDFGPLVHVRTPEGRLIWDFTLLFEDAILVTGPLVLGILFILSELTYKTVQRPARKTTPLNGWLGWAKLILYSSLAGLSTYHSAQLITWSSQGLVNYSPLSISAAALSIFSVLLIPCDSVLHHVYFLRPSSPSQLLLAWWLISDVALIRTRWLFGGNNQTLAIIGVSIAVIKLAIIVTEEWSKRSIMLSPWADVSPEELAGIFNRLLLIWINPLMVKGLGGTIELDDLWPLEDRFSSERIIANMDSSQSSPADERHLFWILVQEHWYLWIIPIPIRLAQAGFSFAQPFLLQETLRWLYGLTGHSTAVGYGLLGAYAITYIGIAITTAFGQYQLVRLVTAVRASLIVRIYRRSLEGKAVQDSDLAPLTLMSANIERIFLGLQYFHEALISVPALGVALWLLERQIGLGAIAPVAIVGVLAVIIGVCVPGIANSQRAWLNAVKSRTKVATQLLLNFRSAKMSGLMGHLAQRLQASRTTELDVSLASRRYQVMTNSLGLGMPQLIPVLALGVYAAVLSDMGQSLNLYEAFTAISFVVLLTFPIGVLLQTAPLLVMALASLNQINKYVREGTPVGHDKEKSTYEKTTKSRHPNSHHVFESIGCALRRPSKDQPVLEDISFSIARSAFTYVLGPSASGKSTLLEALLDEVQPSSGTILRAPDTSDIAYVAQIPWIRNASVKANIIQGCIFDERWYAEVVHAVALEADINIVSRDDAGAGGTTLSGGQKQKVSLARALYSKRKILIIDEPFTGIDGTSSEQISQRVFGPNGLLRKNGITLVMATHSGKNVCFVDHVIVLGSQGRVVQQGRPDDLDLAAYRTGDGRTLYRNVPQHTIDANANPVAYKEAAAHTRTKHRRSGDAAAYYYYFQSLGWWTLLPTCCLVASLVFFQIFPQYWVTWWTDSNDTRPNNSLGYWIGLYATWAFLAVLSLFVACCLMLLRMVQNSGSSLHATLTRTVELAPVSIFANISPGLTVNRFSQDMSLVDMELPLQFANTGIWFVTCVGQLIVVVIASKYLAIAIPFVLIVCITIQQLYIKTSRQLRFLDIESKSPLYSHFIETLNGLSTIRALGLQRVLQDDMNHIIDQSQKPFYLLYCAQRYLGLTLNFVVAGLSVLLIGVAIATRRHPGTNYYGVALVNIMTFGQNLAQFIDQWTRFEVGLAAVERTKDFAESTPKENTANVDPHAGRNFVAGKIRISDLSVGYSPGNPIVKQVSLSIAAGEKVAICGRSGSGKSSLCFALLRMLEAEHGAITIDDRDISHIPHDDLRNAIGSVPQDPLILQGSLRYNLDPFGHCTDEDLHYVLRQVGLETKMEGTKLEANLSAEGLSFAEKQLVCLARALLKRRKVMILDEPTSSVDLLTEKKIHEIVCQGLPGVTVVTVMHRLSHIHLYDKVVVMSHGRIVEEGCPRSLLTKSDSWFSKLHASEQQG